MKMRRVAIILAGVLVLAVGGTVVFLESSGVRVLRTCMRTLMPPV